MNAQRRFVFEKIENFRDLGGYPCKDGGVTKHGRIFRCGMPYVPTERDFELLEKLGIKTVIDFRGSVEAKERPSAFVSRPGFEYHQIPLLEVNPANKSLHSLPVREIYILCAQEHKENFSKVFRLLSRQKAPSVIHCFLGKDRTGITSAILLSLAGVFDEDIIADYQVTETYLRPFYEREFKVNSGLLWESDKSHLKSEPENMCSFLQWLNETHGGTENYLSHIGLNSEEIEALKTILK